VNFGLNNGVSGSSVGAGGAARAAGAEIEDDSGAAAVLGLGWGRFFAGAAFVLGAGRFFGACFFGPGTRASSVNAGVGRAGSVASMVGPGLVSSGRGASARSLGSKGLRNGTALAGKGRSRGGGRRSWLARLSNIGAVAGR
jgi:hypothetical protein